MVDGVMAYKAKRIVLFLSLLFWLSSLLAPKVGAVEYGNIGGKPAYPDPNNSRTQSIFIHYIAPLETQRNGVQVVNFTNETKTLQVYATDSIVSSGGVFGCAQMVDEKKHVGSWVKMDKNEVTLESGDTEIIGFSITAPQGADVGENDGCIVIQEKSGATQTVEGENSSITLSFRTAIRLAVFLPGEVKKSVKILGYAASRSEDGNFVLKPRVKNDGNVSLDATLNTYTRGFFGGGVDNYTQKSPLLRNVTSDSNIPYKRPFWGGWIKSYFTVTYDANTANSLGDDQNEELVTLKSQQIIFFSPPKGLAILLEVLILLVFVAIAYFIYRRFMGGAPRRKKDKWRTITLNNAIDIETLARHYHIGWKKLAKVNRLKAPYILRAGSAVKVPDNSVPAIKSSSGFLKSTRKLTEGWQVVTIQNAVDIETLARKYNVSWKLLAKANSIKAPYIVKANDVVKVPPSSQSARASYAHKMPGTGPLSVFARRRLAENWETITINAQVDGVINSQTDIEAIARAYGVPWKLLAKINKLHPPYILRPGDKIKVPPKNKNPRI
jgi:LysM repeat protein